MSCDDETVTPWVDKNPKHNLDKIFPVPVYSPTLQARFDAQTEKLDNGCVVPRQPKHGGPAPGISIAAGDTVTYGRAAWLLKHGDLPLARLRRTCTTKGCVCADHLEKVPPRFGYTARRVGLSKEERARARALYAQKTPLSQIARELRVSIQTIDRTVR